MLKHLGLPINLVPQLCIVLIQRTFAFSQYAGNGPNPLGIAFDRWGYHYSTDGTDGRSYQVVPKVTAFA